MKIYHEDDRTTLYFGDVREVLGELPDASVDCVATSPPFYGLRDYGTGEWRYENPKLGPRHEWHRLYECDDCRIIRWFSALKHHCPKCGKTMPPHEHDTVGARGGRGGSGTLDKRSGDAMPDRLPAKSCRCGAIYRDPQIGLEATPDEWAAELVAVFRECRRVLRDSGTLWVECGDSYAGSGPNTNAGFNERHGRPTGDKKQERQSVGKLGLVPSGTKQKDLIGAPWLLAFALRADGWYLRQAIIWHKPNAMPESVTDRCTTAHSYVFLFSKRPRYWFDAEAIAEPAEWARWGDQTVPKYEGTDTATGWMQPRTKEELRRNPTWEERKAAGAGRGNLALDGKVGAGTQRAVHGKGLSHDLGPNNGRKNARSVWLIPTQGYPEAHFATWPEALCERIIKAGCPEWVCGVCGRPRERIVERTKTFESGSGRSGNPIEGKQDLAANETNSTPDIRMGPVVSTETVGWSDCGCGQGFQPGVILDPFGGSGTTAHVARKHGRRAILVELNEDYCELAMRRIFRTEKKALESDAKPARDGTLNLFADDP